MSSVASSASSSLDINGIVSQLMQIESRRAVSLQRKEAGYQLKLSSVGSLSSAMSSFKSAVSSLKVTSNFQSMNAESGDSAVFTASASSNAAAGTYNLEVTQLAKANMLVSGAYTDAASTVGTGTLTIQVGSGSAVNVAIDSSSNSLTGVSKAINAAGTDVTASVINDGTGYKLLLTSDKMGSSNTIKVAVTGDSVGTDTDTDGLSNLVYDPLGIKNMTEIQTAQSSTLKMGTLTINKDSNTISDVIEGVTLNLLKEQAGTPVSLTVSNDTATVKKNINKFVAEFNSLVGTINALTGYNAAAETSGPLAGDGTIRRIESQLRSIISSAVPGLEDGINSLSQLGIATQKDGTLKVDSAKLESAVDDNFDGIVKLFARVGDATDANISMYSSTDSTVAGRYSINISQMATQGSFVGTGAAGLIITASSNDSLTLSIDDVSGTIKIAAGVYATAADLAAEIQSKINGLSAFSSAGIEAAVTESGGILTIGSNRYGSSSTVDSISGNAAAGLALTGGTATSGIDVAGTLGGYTATGSGQILTGSSGSPVEGLSLAISGGATGGRGALTYSVGVANLLYDNMDSWLDSTNGIIKSKTDSINASIDNLQDSLDRENRRLIKTEERLRLQYVGLQSLLDSMQGVSSFLDSQTIGLEQLIKR